MTLLVASGRNCQNYFRMSAKSAFQKVQSFIKSESLLKQARGVVIALSGGPDSITLLDIFVRLQKALGKKKNHPQDIRLHLAHLNHQLRGKASERDAEFVEQLAEKLAIPATVAAIDIHELAKKNRKGIEESAREARYKFLLDTAIKTGCDRIATGHTMSDQAETFLLRLARGAGLRGLASMRPAVAAHRFEHQLGGERRESGIGEGDSEYGPSAVRQISNSLPAAPATGDRRLASGERRAASGVLLIRPLLCITREEVEGYCAERRLEYRVDATNQSLDYTRNRIRHEALKLLRDINPRVVEHLAQTAEIIAADQDALDELVHRLLEKAALTLRDGQPDEKRFAYSVNEIIKHPAGLRRRLLMEAIRQRRSNILADRRQLSEIEMAHIKALEALLEDDASGNRIRLPDGLEVWREFEALVFAPVVNSGEPAALSPKQLSPKQRAAQSGAAPVNPCAVTDKDQLIEFGEFRLCIKREQDISLLKAVVEQTQDGKRRTGMDWLTVALDDALLPERLLIRTRQAGEKALVIGQRKIKKLKNLMIDHKIAASRRATWIVVATSDGQYVWSPGLPPAIKFAANNKTERLAILQASNV